MAIRGVAGLVVAGVVAVAGCTANGSPGDGRAPSTGGSAGSVSVDVTETSPRLFVADEDGGDARSGFGGRLGYLARGECFVLDDRAIVADDFITTFRTVVVWPRGTQPVAGDGAAGVDVPGFGVVVEGEWLYGLGSFRTGEGLPDVAAECLGASREYTFIQSIEQTGPVRMAD